MIRAILALCPAMFAAAAEARETLVRNIVLIDVAAAEAAGATRHGLALVIRDGRIVLWRRMCHGWRGVAM